MKKLLLVVVLLFVSVICKGQELQIGMTVKVQDVMGNPKVLEDGTTVYEKIDEIYQTYLGKCELCKEDASIVWAKSIGYMDSSKIFGCAVHSECLKKLFGYFSKKLKKLKKIGGIK